MSTPTPDEIRFARLAARCDADADAALTAEGSSALEADAKGPEALADRVGEQQALREACGRVMAGAAPTCPAALREQLSALAAQTPAEPAPATAPDAEQPAVAGRIGSPRWVMALAAAAVLAISTVVAVGLIRDARTAPGGGGAVVQVFSPQHLKGFDARHGVCGTNPEALFQHERFPHEVAALNAELADVIDASLGTAQLDLSTLGFRYRGTGFCHAPGPGAVHMVYGSDAGQAISLWLRSVEGHPDLAGLEPGQVYEAPAGSTLEGRMVVWRDGNVVLYLLGDLPADVEAARPLLALAAL